MDNVTFDQLTVGQSVRDATTITETHLVLAAGVFKDFNPVHADESFAAASRFGTRVVHGMLTAGRMIGVLGSYLGARGRWPWSSSGSALSVPSILATPWRPNGRSSRWNRSRAYARAAGWWSFAGRAARSAVRQ